VLTTAAALAAAAAMPPRKVRLEVGTTGTRSLRETLEGAVGQLWNRVSTAQKSVKAVPRVETEPGRRSGPSASDQLHGSPVLALSVRPIRMGPGR